jgi:hypothetical protein
MKIFFVTFMSVVVATLAVTKATEAVTTTKAAVTTTKAAVTTTRAKDIHLSKDLTTCLDKGGKWIEITLTDEGGTNGLQLDFVKVDKQVAVKSITTPKSPSRDRRLRESRRNDVVTFKDSFCLDYFGIDYSPCYDVVTSTQGKNVEDLSWSMKVSALKKATEAELKEGKKDQVIEAIKEGAAYDDVKIMCGRLFKQLGRFANRQMTKLQENIALANQEKNVDRHTKEADKMLRTVAKITQKAEDLKLSPAS